MKTSKLFTTGLITVFSFLLFASVIMMVIFPVSSTAQETSPIVKQIAVGKNADGRLELFALCEDDAVYHRWQLTPNGNWSDWAPLNGGGIVQIVVSNQANGALAIFGLGSDKATYWTSQLAPNGDWQTNWKSLNGSGLQQIAVSNGSNGAVYVIGLGTDQATYATWQTSANGGFTPSWSPLNGGGLKQISATNGANGAVYVLGLGTDQATYATWQTSANGGFTPSWSPLNGGGLQQITSGKGANGAVYVFGLGTDQATYATWQTSANGGFTPSWSPLNGGGLQQITSGKGANGAMYLFGIGTNGQAYATWQTSPTAGFTQNWSSLNGGGLTQLASSNYPDGSLALFGVGTDGLVYQTWQLAPNGGWTPSWTLMGSPSIITKIVRGSDPNSWVKCVDIGFNCLTPEWQSVTYAKSNDGIGLCEGNYTTSDLPVIIEGNIHDSHKSTEDNFGAHQSYDYCANIEPDYKYQYLLGNCNSSEDIAQFVDCNNDIVASHNAKTLEMEWETNYLPEKYRPKDNDRAWIMGRWIYDMGHPPAQTEIHPPQAVSFTRLAPDGDTTYVYIYGCCTGAGGAEIPWTGSFYSVSKYNLNSFAIDYNLNVYLPPKPNSTSTLAYTVVEKTYGGPDPIITPQPENGLLNIVCPVSSYFKSNSGAKYGLIIHSYWKTP